MTRRQRQGTGDRGQGREESAIFQASGWIVSDGYKVAKVG